MLANVTVIETHRLEMNVSISEFLISAVHCIQSPSLFLNRYY